jgi:hypothetical protein
MKEDILKRAMFNAPSSKKTMNSGIMSGFEDEMEFEQEDEGEDMPPMARTPQNPEILMNNLRGDIRSVDARYLELAQMVGEQAAMETPPEVLAMLQPQFAAQAAPPIPQGGIGALAQDAQMAAPPMMGQAPQMPPGMEGMPPFPQGGAEQAPPTPDGMPPLRAADGAFVTQDARRQQLYDPLFVPDMQRFNELTSGQVPPDQMTDQERRFLRSYNFGMGFTGGTIRDVASQGFGRISSALSPYVQRGINYLDELVTPFTRPTMRVEPLTGAGGGGRAVIQGRENIVQGTRGAEMGTGTRLQAANTLGFGQIPFSQAVRENPLLNRMVDVGKKYPASTVTGTAGVAGTLAALTGERTPPSRSAQELKDVNALINQIPGQGPPLRDAKGNRIVPPGRENEPFEVNFRDDRIVPPVPERPENATINQVTEPRMDISPFPSVIKPPASEVAPGPSTTVPTKPDISTKTFIDEQLVKGDVKDQVFKTRAERIKAEYESVEPTFREVLGDTKADARTNALLLLADAGFKYASTYGKTPAIALAKAMEGVPRGFAAIVAQARDNGIKIKTAALQQAISSVDTQDKIARDVMLQRMKNNADINRALLQARSKKEVEELKARYKEREIILTGDQNRLTEAWKWGTPEVENVGGGIQIYKWKNGETYTSFDKNSDIPTRFLESRYTNKLTNPYVTDRGPSAMTPVRDKASVKTALDDISSYDLALREVDNLRTKVLGSYSPGTWAVDKYNNIIVPLTFNTITPIVKEETLSAAIKLSAESISKAIASAGQSGRLSNQNIQYAREALDSLLNPTNFMKNPELAAGVLSTLETRLRNGRQAVGEQLGYVKEDLTADIPATGSQNNPFIYGSADSEQAARMDMYLKNLYKGQDPNVPVYVNINGQTGRTTIGKILQAR